MNKVLLGGIIVFVMFLFNGCNIESINEKADVDEKNIVIENNTEPKFTDEDYWPEYMLSGISVEDTGKNVKAHSEKEVYSTSDEYISCILESGKKGTGFYYYGIPYIEKLEGEKWIRLHHSSKNLAMEQWCICAIEDGDDRYFSCKLTVTVENISPKLAEGTYRFAIFLTDRVVYALFDVEGGK